jgi:hypothetical protein
VESFWRFTDGTDRIGTTKTSGKIYAYDSTSKDFTVLSKASKFHSAYSSLSKDASTGRLKFTFPSSYDCQDLGIYTTLMLKNGELCFDESKILQSKTIYYYRTGEGGKYTPNSTLNLVKVAGTYYT